MVKQIVSICICAVLSEPCIGPACDQLCIGVNDNTQAKCMCADGYTMNDEQNCKSEFMKSTLVITMYAFSIEYSNASKCAIMLN